MTFMSEITPITVTQRAAEASTDQGIVGYEPNLDNIAKLVEAANRPDIDPSKLALAIGSGTGFQVERAKTPLLDGTDISQPDTIDHNPETSLIRVNIPRRTPITETELARQLAAHLLSPKHKQNEIRRLVPGGLLTGTALLALIPGGVEYMNNYSNEIETWSLIGGGSVALAVGGLLLRSFFRNTNQLDAVQFGAAPVLRPIIVHRIALTETRNPVPGPENGPKNYVGTRRAPNGSADTGS